jgi:hypothetical protein
MNWTNAARHHLVSQGVALLLLGTCAFSVGAKPVQIAGSPTTLVGSDERMISYRNQQHMWQTSDGLTHLIVNRGITRDGTSLVLQSTIDGVHWTQMATLPDTNLSSSSDSLLSGDDLQVTYSGAMGEIAYATYHYDSASRTWSSVAKETVYAAPGVVGLTPALTQDANGRVWLAFTAWDLTTLEFRIKMMYKDSGASPWVDTGFTFGTPDSVSNERSARPVVIANGIGLVYTVHQNIYWAWRLNKWPLTAEWPRSLIYPNQAPDTDPYGTHYSATTDAQGNVHLVSVDGGRLVYSRYLNSTQAWTTRIMTDDIAATYPKVVVSGPTLMVVTNSESWLRVFESTDGGTSFVNTHLLTHPAPTGKEDYSRPRVELPAHPQVNPVMVLQQYVDGVMQRAMEFEVPSLTQLPPP